MTAPRAHFGAQHREQPVAAAGAGQPSPAFALQRGQQPLVASGPGNANVAVPALGGLILTLNNAAVATKDNFATLGAGLYARYVVDPRWSLIGSFSGNGRGNQNGVNSIFNSLQFDGNFGASYRYDRHEFSGVVQVGSYDINGTRARNQAGIVAEWAYRIDSTRQLGSYLQWGTLSYPGQAVRDVDRTVIGSSYAHSFSNDFVALSVRMWAPKKKKTALFRKSATSSMGSEPALRRK